MLNLRGGGRCIVSKLGYKSYRARLPQGNKCSPKMQQFVLVNPETWNTPPQVSVHRKNENVVGKKDLGNHGGLEDHFPV